MKKPIPSSTSSSTSPLSSNTNTTTAASETTMTQTALKTFSENNLNVSEKRREVFNHNFICFLSCFVDNYQYFSLLYVFKMQKNVFV